jgi:hypothetical protein
MIEKFYAAHIKNTLDAAAINVMRPRPRYEREDAQARHETLRERGLRRQKPRARRTPNYRAKVETAK